MILEDMLENTSCNVVEMERLVEVSAKIDGDYTGGAMAKRLLCRSEIFDLAQHQFLLPHDGMNQLEMSEQSSAILAMDAEANSST